MDSLEVALTKHAPWYDSFDQSSDSWGCECDHIAKYRTREEVVAQHIAPVIRNIAVSTNERLADIQKQFDTNGNLIRGQSDRKIWDDVNRLIEFCRANKLDNLAMAFASYEDERKRQGRAVENLETQLTQLSDTYRESNAKWALLTHILEQSGMDPDVLIKTHEVFADKPKGKYCKHGNDWNQPCWQCNRT